jgi:cyclic pyranopterin phosphate synthase
MAAAKQTHILIPHCHQIPLDTVQLSFQLDEDGVRAGCFVRAQARTGVEMEALTGVSVGLLTIYDMLKAIDKGMIIKNIQLENKSGGKSGDFNRA